MGRLEGSEAGAWLSIRETSEVAQTVAIVNGWGVAFRLGKCHFKGQFDHFSGSFWGSSGWIFGYRVAGLGAGVPLVQVGVDLGGCGSVISNGNSGLFRVLFEHRLVGFLDLLWRI